MAGRIAARKKRIAKRKPNLSKKQVAKRAIANEKKYYQKNKGKAMPKFLWSKKRKEAAKGKATTAPKKTGNKPADPMPTITRPSARQTQTAAAVQGFKGGLAGPKMARRATQMQAVMQSTNTSAKVDTGIKKAAGLSDHLRRMR